MKKSIVGNIVQILEKAIFYGIINYDNDKIISIEKTGDEKEGEPYIIPGFIDSHVHIESSMLIPSEFARIAVVHGTIGTVSDPHEIANVCGVDGVKYMIENGKKVPFYFCFGAPSCVPATIFETAGASLNSQEVEELLQLPEIGYLSEVMNFPGVLNNDEELMLKIKAAKNANKPIDGHAPGLMGELAKKYIDAGIETDHECFTNGEALEKLKLGMKILIREGSAAKNFEELILLADEYYTKMMFCSDDKHPDDLVEGHINQLVKRAIHKGIDRFKVLRMATINPILHYRMNIGLLREGDWGDFIVVDNLDDFNVLETYINGTKVAENGLSLIENLQSEVINNFNCEPIENKHIKIAAPENVQRMRVIQTIDGQLITNEIFVEPKIENGLVVSDLDKDILKIVVLNRYKVAPPVIEFINNYGLKEGAIASSVGHDSHNIIAVGVDDFSICEAINLIIREKGGVAAVSNTKRGVLGLPVAGLMSCDDGYKVAESYSKIDKFVKDQLGTTLISPFMSLSFMALLVIPTLKLSDLGLFDGEKFEFVDLFEK
jgi:adenine deaminase